MTEDPNRTWFLQDLCLTHEHLVSNCEECLATKMVESHGGPLFFKLMMDLLQNSPDEAAAFLINTVMNLMISSFEGENLEKLVSLLRGVFQRLENLKLSTGVPALPVDFADTLIKVFQMSSVPEFNDLFKLFKTEQTMSGLRNGTNKPAPLPPLSQILKFAKTQYRTMCSTNDWTGVKTKASATAFTTAATSLKKDDHTCWNCGDAHALPKCPKPRDATKIKAAKKAFWDAKRKGKKGKEKPPESGTTSSTNTRTRQIPAIWAPPTEEEKNNNNNRHHINGKWHFYRAKDKRWVVLKEQPQPPAVNNITNTPTVNPAPAPSPAPAPAPPGASTTQAQEVALANSVQQIATVLRGLLRLQFH